MLTIDGSLGEGGGQILRSALALSAITGTAVRIERIRARRPKPGLQRQHLVAVQAAARVSGAHVTGAELHSHELEFTPQDAASGLRSLAGTYDFDIGTAGSTTLVLQTVMPILWHADAASTVTIRGGTHNGMCPPVEFVQDSFLPVLHCIGINATVDLQRYGFYPAGGGATQAVIQPWQTRAPLALLERGKAIDRHADVLLANLPAHVASREAVALKHALHWSHREVDEREVAAHGPGNVVLARLRFANLTTRCTAVGELRKAAEVVAADCAKHIEHYLATDAPVCEHLADQLLLPLAIGAGGTFRTGDLSEHTRTNAAIIARFLGEVVTFSKQSDGTWLVEVASRIHR